MPCFNKFKKELGLKDAAEFLNKIIEAHVADDIIKELGSTSNNFLTIKLQD